MVEMKAETKRAPKKTHEAIAALLAHPTMKEAAEAVGIGESTLFRWMQDEQFREDYRKARGEVVRQAIARLQRASGEAVDTLRTIMKDDIKPASARVTAARTILDTAVKAVEIEDLEARIEHLEFLLRNEK